MNLFTVHYVKLLPSQFGDLHSILTWLNAMATISHVLNFNVTTIQGGPLIDGGIYCTEEPSVQQYSLI